MNWIYFTLFSILLIVSAAFLYFYVEYRKKSNDEVEKVKSFFKPGINYKTYISALLAFLSIFIMLFSHYKMEQTVMQSFMYGEIFLWLACISYIDYKEQIIPNKLILVGLAFWIALEIVDIFVAKTPWKEALAFSLIGGLLCGFALMIVSILMKSALGMGDVKMFTVLGLLLGIWNVYSLLLVSLFIMAFLSIILLFAKKITRKSKIPMAPFVFIGFIICVFLGM